MSLTITETKDVGLIDSIIRDDSVYPFVVDDACPPAHEFTIAPIADQLTAYLVVKDHETAGVFIFTASGEMHTCLLENCRGRLAVEAGKRAIELFQSAKQMPVTGFAWKELPHTVWYARAIGLERLPGESVWPNTRGAKRVHRINFRKEFPCHS